VEHPPRPPGVAAPAPLEPETGVAGGVDQVRLDWARQALRPDSRRASRPRQEPQPNPSTPLRPGPRTHGRSSPAAASQQCHHALPAAARPETCEPFCRSWSRRRGASATPVRVQAPELLPDPMNPGPPSQSTAGSSAGRPGAEPPNPVGRLRCRFSWCRVCRQGPSSIHLFA